MHRWHWGVFLRILYQEEELLAYALEEITKIGKIEKSSFLLPVKEKKKKQKFLYFHQLLSPKKVARFFLQKQKIEEKILKKYSLEIALEMGIFTPLHILLLKKNMEKFSIPFLEDLWAKLLYVYDKGKLLPIFQEEGYFTPSAREFFLEAFLTYLRHQEESK